MSMVRNFFAVIVGYLIFAVSAAILFKISGIDPHAEAGAGTIATVLLFGGVFSFIGGYLAKTIAATHTPWANYALAFLIAAFAAFSYLKSPGSHYTQLASIFLFAPLSLAGGLLRRRTEHR